MSTPNFPEMRAPAALRARGRTVRIPALAAAAGAPSGSSAAPYFRVSGWVIASAVDVRADPMARWTGWGIPVAAWIPGAIAA